MVSFFKNNKFNLKNKNKYKVQDHLTRSIKKDIGMHLDKNLQVKENNKCTILEKNLDKNM